MVKVDEYARIRRAYRVDKLSIRELARRFHHSRRKIREILGQAEPKPYQRRLVILVQSGPICLLNTDPPQGYRTSSNQGIGTLSRGGPGGAERPGA
jgi:hypothetical protein